MDHNIISTQNKKIRWEDHRCNFKSGKVLYLVKCPKCNKENYAPAVTSGQCAWCGWKE